MDGTGSRFHTRHGQDLVWRWTPVMEYIWRYGGGHMPPVSYCADLTQILTQGLPGTAVGLWMPRGRTGPVTF